MAKMKCFNVLISNYTNQLYRVRIVFSQNERFIIAYLIKLYCELPYKKMREIRSIPLTVTIIPQAVTRVKWN